MVKRNPIGEGLDEFRAVFKSTRKDRETLGVLDALGQLHQAGLRLPALLQCAHLTGIQIPRILVSPFF